MTKARINRRIASLGLEIQANRGDGYAYFTDLKTGNQVGDSVCVCYLNQMSLEKWVACAEYEKSVHEKRNS